MRPRVFVGSSGEAITICRAVQAELDDDFDITVWNQDVFNLNYAALDSLLEALDSSDESGSSLGDVRPLDLERDAQARYGWRHLLALRDCMTTTRSIGVSSHAELLVRWWRSKPAGRKATATGR